MQQLSHAEAMQYSSFMDTANLSPITAANALITIGTVSLSSKDN